MKEAIVHSFHSQVPDTVADLEDWLDLVICLDAHLDLSFGVRESQEGMPEKIKLAALRASAHSQLRRCTGNMPALREPDEFVAEMLLVVPRSCLITYVAGLEKDLDEVGAAGDLRSENPVASYVELLKDHYGIELYLSPPQDLMKLAERTRNADHWLLDIDVDYMYDMQKECYTPMKKAGPGDLRWSERVLRFVRKCKPDLITISEAKVQAMRDPNSVFSGFATRLKSVGYELHERVVFRSDKEAQELLDLYQEYYEKVQKGLMVKNVAGFVRTRTPGNDDQYYAELVKAQREFFAKKRMEGSSLDNLD